jgi:hypothetical protein
MTAPDPPSGIDSVAASAAEAQEAPDLRQGQIADAGEAYDIAELGKDCPVTPLGFMKQKFYFLDFAGQLIELGSEFRKGELMALFGTRMGWLEKKWPQYKKVGDRKTGETDDAGKPVTVPIFEEDGFSQKLAQQGLIMACSKADIFDPRNKVRGRGAHRGRGGELILHCGNELLVGGRKGTRGQPIKSQWYRSGPYGGYIYPTAEALPHPDDRPAEVNIGMEVLRLLESWRWKRGAIDAYLMLCWLVAANLGGALKIRPHGWIVGPTGAGKSTLQDLIEALMRGWGLRTEDASAAGVRQTLDQDTLAVMFDEIEAEENNHDVVMQIVRLARLAYSGASAVRGSVDHQARQFVARSCFLFSSIHHHELPAQDRNRIAILSLDKFPPKTAKLVLPATLEQWGDAMRRRLVEQWGRYDATLARYQAEMLDQGYSGREQDTYGTLLACGDLALHDSEPRTREDIEARGGIDRVAERVRALARVIDVQRAETIDTTERCLGHLLTTPLPASAGRDQETVARWIAKSLITIHSVKLRGAQSKIANAAREKLLANGMRLFHLNKGHDDGNGQSGYNEAYLFDEKPDEEGTGRLALDIWLAVAGQTNVGMKQIFKNSAWSTGNWNQPLALVPGAVTRKKARFGGAKPESCTLIPLSEFLDIPAVLQEAREAAAQGELDAGGAEARG